MKDKDKFIEAVDSWLDKVAEKKTKLARQNVTAQMTREQVETVLDSHIRDKFLETDGTIIADMETAMLIKNAMEDE